MCSKSLPSTTFSTPFDRKLRLEMGWYDAGSLRSIVRFFSSGRTMALLQSHGNMSCWNDALQTAAMIGASTWLAHLTSQVGTGSSLHCSADDFWSIFTISSAVTGTRSDSGWSTVWSLMMDWRLLGHGCGRSLPQSSVRSRRQITEYRRQIAAVAAIVALTTRP